MKYYLSCKYNGPKGLLLTIAIVRQDNTAIYLGLHNEDAVNVEVDPWVSEHIVPVMNSSPINLRWVSSWQAAEHIGAFFRNDIEPHIFAASSVDFVHFLNARMHPPNHEVGLSKGYKLELICDDVHPTEVATAVRHNAVWDAMALKHLVEWPNGMKG